jgi:hypothetical protein
MEVAGVVMLAAADGAESDPVSAGADAAGSGSGSGLAGDVLG